MDIWFWVWATAAAFLFVAEIFTAGFFMLPFGIGAAVAALLQFLGVDLAWQWVAFIAVSAIALVSLRRFADRLTHEPPERTGVDRVIAKRGIVIEELTPNSAVGQVRIDREEWRADAPGHGVVPVGTAVVVDGIEGTHLVVHPVESPDA